MYAFYIILAACPVLVTVGIRKRDRSGLNSPTGNRIDRITRRTLGGSFNNNDNDESADQ
jgi:hypothetical protein